MTRGNFFSSESMFNVFPLWQCDYIFLSFDNNLSCGSHLEMLHLEVVRDGKSNLAVMSPV